MPADRTNLQVSPADVRFLEKRGARSHRGPGTFSRSAVLHRTLQTLSDLYEHSDPRRTRNMPEALHQVVVHIIPEPWKLRALEIEHLPTVLERAPGFAAAAAAASLDPAAILAAVNELTYPEKLTLVDHALQQQAPAASAASPEEP